MRFVNISTRMVINPFVGMLKPGRVSPDGGERRRRLENALSEVIKACGSSMAIQLNQAEMTLLDRLMSLNEKGTGFDKSSIPLEIRRDPLGQKRADEAMHEAQRKESERKSEAVRRDMLREAIINGEVSEDKGTKVTASDLKSGFEKILEENRAIEAGKKVAPDSMINLDPVGTLAKKDGASAVKAADPDLHDRNADATVEVKKAKGRSDDAVRSADAEEPKFATVDKAGKMDAMAAEVAEKLATVGPAKKKAKSKKSK